MPIEVKDKVLTVAISNPMDIWLAEDIKMHLGYQVHRVLSTKSEIDEAIHKYYGVVAETVDQILSESTQHQDQFILKARMAWKRLIRAPRRPRLLS